MKLRYSIAQPRLPRCVCFTTSLLLGLFSFLGNQPLLGQINGNYSTPGLYTYTVPSGGPLQIRLTALGGDGGGQGGSGASAGSTFTVQSGDVLTMIVGQSGATSLSGPAGGGGGGGSAVVLTRNGTRTLLVAAGGGGGGAARMLI